MGGKQLSSTGGGYSETQVKVYPPSSAASDTSVTTPTGGGTGGASANGEAKEEDSPGKDEDEPDPEPVGESCSREYLYERALTLSLQ